MDKKAQLAALIKEMEAAAGKLPLTKRAADIVPPEGNPEAEVMFIGEAAGYHESVQRRPFVGAAGKLLTQTLTEIGLRREAVWISNLIKTRPPENRDPLPEEIKAYSKYLDREIEIIEPKVIVTLGRFSMSKFLPGAKISQIHGQARWTDWEDRKILVVPMYHPAAALRAGEVMRQFREDFGKLKQILITVRDTPPRSPSGHLGGELKKEAQPTQLSLV
jgi:uracil-DNA glycosylase